MRALRDVGCVQGVVERIVLAVVILQGHHEGDEGLSGYVHRGEKVPVTERGVRHAGQRSAIAQFSDAEYVDAPVVDQHQTLAQILFVRCFDAVLRQFLAGEGVGVTQGLAIDARYLRHGRVSAPGALLTRDILRRLGGFF